MRRNTQDRQIRSAFTLIEVLVVVAIIALLISILLPSLAKARDQARKVVCMNHQKQLANANYYYSADHRGRLPHFDYWLYTRDSSTGLPAGAVPECGQLFGLKTPDRPRGHARNYAATAQIYLCPSDKGHRWDPPGRAVALRPPTFSYTRNKYIMNRLGFAPSDQGGIEIAANYFPINRPKRPAETPLLLEEYEYSPMNDGHFVNELASGGENSLDYLTTRHGGREVATAEKIADFAKPLQNDGAGQAMVSFHDMHVASYRSVRFNTARADDAVRHHFLAPGTPLPTTAGAAAATSGK